MQREIERAVGLDLGGFFAACVRGREDPDLAGALRAVGYELRVKPEKEKDRDEDAPGAWLGVNTKTEGGRLVVASVPSGSPAETAGLYAGDEIVGIDGFRVGDERTLGDRLSSRHPGAPARLLVFRRDEEVRLEVVLGERPASWEIVADPSADEEAKRLGHAWLGEE